MDDNINIKKENQFSKYFDLIIPASTITLISFIIYCVGFSYLSGFFSIFNIDISSLNLPFTFFVQKSILPIFHYLSLLIVGGYIGFFGNDKQLNKAKVFNRIFKIISVFAIPILYLKSQISNFNNIIEITWLIRISLVLSSLIFSELYTEAYYSIKRLEIKSLVNRFKLGCFIISLILLFFLSFYDGISHAKDLKQGKQYTSINVELKKAYKEEQINLNIKNKKLILVVFANNSYYLFDKDDRSPDNPNIYIIPKEETKWIRMKKG